MDYSQHFNTRHTPQTVSVPGKDQVENSAGGHVHRLKRQNRLWFLPDGSMYVYFVPVQWRYLGE